MMLGSGGGWNLFRREDPKELVQRWKASIRSEVRGAEREVQAIIFEQKKAAKAIKDAASRNDMASARILAREVVRLRATVGRIAANKAAMLSLGDQMTQTMAMSKLAGTLQASTGVMKSINRLMRVPEVRGTVKDMAREMARAGYIREMLDESVESAVDCVGLEEEAAAEVDAVLQEITGETMTRLTAIPQHQPQAAAAPAEQAAQRLHERDQLEATLQELKAS